IKHNNPCGAARSGDLLTAFQVARACDPVSAFGAVVAVSEPVGPREAAVLAETFLEVIVAPAFDPAAIELLAAKKNLRLLEVGLMASANLRENDVRGIRGGVLVQTADVSPSIAKEVEDARVV